ncbi:MAG: hypothetical protein ACYTGV_08345 [Planctomycetota bacterium]
MGGGLGLAEDQARAAVWLMLAKERGQTNAGGLLKRVLESLAPDQPKEADRLLEEFREKHGEER